MAFSGTSLSTMAPNVNYNSCTCNKLRTLHWSPLSFPRTSEAGSTSASEAEAQVLNYCLYLPTRIWKVHQNLATALANQFSTNCVPVPSVNDAIMFISYSLLNSHSYN